MTNESQEKNAVIRNFKWNDFPDIKTAADLDNYIKYTDTKNITGETKNLRAYKHGNFFHYSTLGKIDEILGSKSLLLFNPGKSNDPKEKNIASKEEKFVTCFSTGIHENIPMWYLYGGVDGHGGCISFSKSTFRHIINDGEYSLIEIDEHKRERQNAKPIPLPKEKVKITLQDIVYYEDNKLNVTLKYNNQTNNGFPLPEFEKFKQNNQDFLKSLCWYYEKETRLQVEICDNEIAKKMGDKLWAVKLSFENVSKINSRIKLILAPKGEKDNGESIDARISSYANIKEFMIDSSNLKNSTLDGMVKIDPCKNCDKNKTDNKQST